MLKKRKHLLRDLGLSIPLIACGIAYLVAGASVYPVLTFCATMMAVMAGGVLWVDQDADVSLLYALFGVKMAAISADTASRFLMSFGSVVIAWLCHSLFKLVNQVRWKHPTTEVEIGDWTLRPGDWAHLATHLTGGLKPAHEFEICSVEEVLAGPTDLWETTRRASVRPWSRWNNLEGRRLFAICITALLESALLIHTGSL
jgi:hypothetical protein